MGRAALTTTRGAAPIWRGLLCAVWLCATVIGAGVAEAKVVVFNDPYLEGAVRTAIDKPEGDILDSDLVGLESLNASSLCIQDLTGLEYCTDLKRLELNSNGTANIAQLRYLTKLTELSLRDNQINDIGPLATLTNLKLLLLQNNEIVDISALRNCVNLESLNLDGNRVASVTALRNLTGLSEVSLRDNQVTSIGGLSRLAQLALLFLRNNEIDDITALANNTSLTHLELDGNLLTDVTALAKLTRLVELSLQDNQVKRVDVLAGLPDLAVVLLRGNVISDITPLENNPGIGMGDVVDFTGNRIEPDQLHDVSIALANRGVTVYVEFPDPILEQVVRVAINKPSGQIVYTDVVGVGFTLLDGAALGIQDLTGLEFCSDLTDVYLWDNALTDVRALASLENLVFVFLQNNTLQDISPLMDSVGLDDGDTLDLRGNLLDQYGLCQVIPALDARGVTVNHDGECGTGTAVVYIPDANLEAVLRVALDKPTGDIIADDLAERVLDLNPDHTPLEELDASNAGITDLTGLDYCVNLTTLQLSGNNIAEVNALRNLSRIHRLYLGWNEIEDIEPLSGLYGLEYLDLQNNTISDLNGLQHLGGLVALYLNDNEIVHVDELEWLRYLGLLFLSNNSIRDIGPLSWLHNLEWLDVGGNAISDVTPLAAMTQLVTLGLWDNEIDALSSEVFSQLTQLSWLDCAGNSIQNIASLAALRDLQFVYLDNNNISNIALFSGLQELSVLSLRNNWITDLSPLVANAAIGLGDIVNVNGNPLTVDAVCNDIPALQKRYVRVGFDFTCDPLAKTYSLTVLIQGDGAVAPVQGTHEFVEGTEIVLTPAGAPGWVFEQWQGALNTTERTVTVTMDGDKVITALFVEEIATNTLTIDVSGNGTVRPSPGTHTYSIGAVVDIEATPAAGWALYRWLGDLSGTLSPQTLIMDTDKSVTAVFRKRYSLTTHVVGHGTIEEPERELDYYIEGEAILVRAVPDLGWEFVRWEGDIGACNNSRNPIALTMDSNKQLTAVFTQGSYTLSLDTLGQGSVTINGQAPGPSNTYLGGRTLVLEATPASGWLFDRWEGDIDIPGEDPQDPTENPLTIIMDADRAITAVFLEGFTLTTAVEGEGTVVVDPADRDVFPDGEAITLLARPAVGWRFDHWQGDLSSDVNPTTVVMNANKEITAVFVEDAYAYTLTLAADGEGAVTSSPDTFSPIPGAYRYAEGQVVTIAATPGSGWVFDHWADDLSGDENPAFVTMNADKSVRAVFVQAPVTFNLITLVQGQGSVTPPVGTHLYAAGKNVTVTAIPDPGWALDHWYVEKWVVDHWEPGTGGTGNPIVVALNNDTRITAVLQKIPTLSAVTPDEGLATGGETVLISGSVLSSVTMVTFGDAAADIMSVTDTGVLVKTPAHPAGTVDVTVHTTAVSATLEDAFAFTAAPDAPLIGALTPRQGKTEGGEAVLIRGQNLQTTQSVLFGGAQATIMFPVDQTRLNVVTPPHAAGTVDLEVTTASGTAELADAFTYIAPPQIISVSPSEGSSDGGETVTIQGTTLTNPTAVLFGSAHATVLSADSTRLVVLTPALDLDGAVDVSVATAGGTATSPNAFSYFTGVATIRVYVADAETLQPLLNATVVLTPVGLTITGSADGNYLFTSIRPNETYTVSVSAQGYEPAALDVTVAPDDAVTLPLNLTPTPSDTSESICGLDIKRLESEIAETTIPLSVQQSPASTVSPASVLAIRLSGPEPIDPASVWALVESDDWAGAGGTWRPTVPGDDRDGWVLFTPEEAMPAGALVTMTVSAATADGTAIEPLSQDFRIARDKASEVPEPALIETVDAGRLPSLLAAPRSCVYRVVPEVVFEAPVTVQIPVDPAGDPDDLDIYYYSESAEHPGWYPCGNVVGWLAPGSRRIVQADGQTYIEIQVNHSGVLQLGQAIKVELGGTADLDIGVEGSRVQWLSLGFVLLGLSLMLGRLRTKGGRL